MVGACRTLKPRVGRNGKTYELGYKLHVAADAKSELPRAVVAASANENEKKHASALFRKALKTTKRRTKTLVADSQYSSRKLREQLSAHNVKTVIPYPANPSKEKKTLLRVDRCFRTHGPACERQIYTQRGAIERVNSRFKEQLCLERHRARGLERITIHALHNRHASKCTNSVKAEQTGKSQIHHYARKIKRN